jgi:hypothetical protein
MYSYVAGQGCPCTEWTTIQRRERADPIISSPVSRGVRT